EVKDPDFDGFGRFEMGKKMLGLGMVVGTITLEGLASGTLKPVVAKTFSLEEFVEAHRFLESNQQIGKIVVTV
ncbi:MAG: zinc-binding dehydrogenase, partial [Nitrospirales bacterium]